MDLRLLLDAPVGFIRENIRALGAIALVGGFAASLPNLVFYGVVGTPQVNAANFDVGVMAGIYGVALVSMVLQVYLQLVLYSSVRQVMDGEPVGVVAAFAGALRWRWIGALLAKYMIYLASACFCWFPMLYFGPAMATLMPCVVAESPGPAEAVVKAIRQAHYAPKTGRYSHTFMRIIVGLHAMTVVMAAVAATTSAPAMVIAWVQAWRQIVAGGLVGGAPVAPAWVTLPLNALSTVGWSIAWLYPVVLFTMLYRDVRDVSEGHDLDAFLDRRLGADGG